MTTKTNKLIRAWEVAHRLRLGPAWIRDEAAAGRIPSLNAGGTLLFNLEAVCAALDKRASEQRLPVAEPDALLTASELAATVSAQLGERLTASDIHRWAIAGELSFFGYICRTPVWRRRDLPEIVECVAELRKGSRG